MDPDRWRRVDQFYHAALEIELSQRAAFIEEACAADASLKQEVESLLAQAEAGESFLEVPAVAMMGQALPPANSVIGRYRILRLLGEGGMGAVYEAEQDQPRRTVALKIVKPGFATAETLRRFQHESQALGRLQHPGIAQIYEAATADTGFGPQPYFAMELIRGLPLHEYADQHKLTARDRLALMAKVCDAVDHAHQRGVIHRDLKPGNILVDETGQPKILDFGVARVTESEAQHTRQTDLGQLVGTLAYMSPEQVASDPAALDLRSDVYALGVILYELLAAKPPYDISRKPLPEAVAVIREEEPSPLSSINRSYRGDIDTIAAKALEKDKARRYASAAELAADVRRYLADEPITARPASATYQLQKFARRHKALVSGTAAVFLVLTAGVAASTFEAVRARKAERAAATEAATAEAINNFLQNDLLAQASASNQAGPSTKPDPELKVRTALDRAAARIAGKFDKQPEVEAAIRFTIGQTYLDLGLFAEAEKQLERALSLQRRAQGSASPNTLRMMTHLARAEYLQGKYAGPDTLLNQALATQRHVLGPEHRDTLQSINWLSSLRELQGKNAEAGALLAQALEIERRVLGPEHPDTLRTEANLALVYCNQGMLPQAEAVYSQSLEKQRRVFGPEHPTTLNSMSNLALVYENLGKYAQSEALYSQTLDIKRRTLGPEHPRTLGVMGNLAVLYQMEGKYTQAETLGRESLEKSRRVLGPEHPDTLWLIHNLGDMNYDLGRYAQAEAFHTQGLQLRRRVLGPEHPDTLKSMGNLAKIYAVERKYALADALFSETLEKKRRVLGPDASETLNTAYEIALRYQRAGMYALAESYAAQYVRGARKADGADIWPGALLPLTLAYLSQGKFIEAEPLARESLDLYRQKRPDDLMVFRAEAELGASLSGEQKYAEAEPLLLAAYKGMVTRKVSVPDLYYMDLTHKWLVQLYQAWRKPEKAVEWRKN